MHKLKACAIGFASILCVCRTAGTALTSELSASEIHTELRGCNFNEPWLCSEYAYYESHTCTLNNVCIFNEYAFVESEEFSTKMTHHCRSLSYDCKYFHQIKQCRSSNCATHSLCNVDIDGYEMCLIKALLCYDEHCEPDLAALPFDYRLYDLCCHINDIDDDVGRFHNWLLMVLAVILLVILLSLYEIYSALTKHSVYKMCVALYKKITYAGNSALKKYSSMKSVRQHAECLYDEIARRGKKLKRSMKQQYKNNEMMWSFLGLFDEYTSKIHESHIGHSVRSCFGMRSGSTPAPVPTPVAVSALADGMGAALSADEGNKPHAAAGMGNAAVLHSKKSKSSHRKQQKKKKKKKSGKQSKKDLQIKRKANKSKSKCKSKSSAHVSKSLPSSPVTEYSIDKLETLDVDVDDTHHDDEREQETTHERSDIDCDDEEEDERIQDDDQDDDEVEADDTHDEQEEKKTVELIRCAVCHTMNEERLSHCEECKKPLHMKMAKTRKHKAHKKKQHKRKQRHINHNHNNHNHNVHTHNTTHNAHNHQHNHNHHHNQSGWQCAECSYHNPHKASHCMMCDSHTRSHSRSIPPCNPSKKAQNTHNNKRRQRPHSQSQAHAHSQTHRSSRGHNSGYTHQIPLKVHRKEIVDISRIMAEHRHGHKTKYHSDDNARRARGRLNPHAKEFVLGSPSEAFRQDIPLSAADAFTYMPYPSPYGEYATDTLLLSPPRMSKIPRLQKVVNPEPDYMHNNAHESYEDYAMRSDCVPPRFQSPRIEVDAMEEMHPSPLPALEPVDLSSLYPLSMNIPLITPIAPILSPPVGVAAAVSASVVDASATASATTPGGSPGLPLKEIECTDLQRQLSDMEANVHKQLQVLDSLLPGLKPDLTGDIQAMQENITIV